MAKYQQIKHKGISSEPASSVETFSSEITPIGAYSFDPLTQTLSRDGMTNSLSWAQSSLLQLLLSKKNRPVFLHEIARHVWPEREAVSSANIYNLVSKLRVLLKDDPSIKIINCRGLAYKLVLLA